MIKRFGDGSLPFADLEVGDRVSLIVNQMTPVN